MEKTTHPLRMATVSLSLPSSNDGNASKKKAPEPGVALGLAQYSFTFEISPLYASAIRGR